MPRIVACLVLAICLAACGIVDTLVEGWKHAKAVETDLAAATGVKPQVGFNWNNGRLTLVTVTFPQLYEAKPLAQLSEMVRRSVIAEFQQTPQSVVLGFAIGNTLTGPAAQLREMPANMKTSVL